MKIYFSSSVRTKNYYDENIKKIHQLIGELGYSLTSNFIVKVKPEEFYKRTPQEAVSFYKKMVREIKAADICVFEISLDSSGIGYSINMALDSGKPVVALHVPERKPYLLQMINHPKVQVLEYTPEDLKEVLKDALDLAKEQMDVRFTFFITPKISQYLDFIKKKRKIARATLLRTLIEKEMKKDKEFRG